MTILSYTIVLYLSSTLVEQPSVIIYPSKMNILKILSTLEVLRVNICSTYTLTAVLFPCCRFPDRRSRSEAVPRPHGRVSRHCYARGRRGEAQVRGTRVDQSRNEKQMNPMLMQRHMTWCDSGAGWLTMKAAPCAVKPDPCGGWSL